MKKIIAMLLTLSMLVACAACGGKDDTTQTSSQAAESTEAATSTEEATESEAVESTEESQAASDSTVTYFSVSYGETFDNVASLSAYDDYAGGAYVEYLGAERKITTMDLSVLEGITAELANSGLLELAGQDVYEDGEASASLSVEYADGTSVTAAFYGTIPQEFIDGFTAMDAYFQTMLADVPVYVPEPMVMGEVNEAVLTELKGILNESGIDPLDSIGITDVPMDEYFGFTLGLTNSEGIVNGTNCTSMIMSVAYSIAIVTVEDAANIPAVAEDFASNLDWQKWVCVFPTDALIAQKDNMVLCLMGSDEMYAQSASAIEAAGWTTIQTIANPDM